MPKVKYVGTATIRKINKSDFQGVGVDDQDAVVFAVHNGWIADVSDNAAAYLCTHDTFVSIGDGDGQVKGDSKKAEKRLTSWGGAEPERPPATTSVGAGDEPTEVGTTEGSTPGDDATPGRTTGGRAR